MEKDKEIIEKKKAKSSRKARSGLPQVNMVDALEYTKIAYKITGTTLKSFSGMAEAMGMKTGHAIKAFGELSNEYGLIEPIEGGWRISDLGRRASNGERSAVVEVLERNKILKVLYAELKDKEFDRDYLEDYIKKKRFAYNIKTSLVTDRFLAAMDYIKLLQEGGGAVVVAKVEKSTIENSLLISIMQLKYALSPPSKSEVLSLTKNLSKEANKSEDIVIKSLTEQMLNKSDNEQVLRALLDSLIQIISQNNPSLSFETGSTIKDEEVVDDESPKEEF